MGISIYLFDQIIANIGLVFQLNPIVVSVVPGMVLIAVAAHWLLRRTFEMNMTTAFFVHIIGNSKTSLWGWMGVRASSGCWERSRRLQW